MWSLRFQRYSKQTQCVEAVRKHMICTVYTVGYILYLHACLLLQYLECRRLFDTEHALKVLFCQALKHSGRLIKSIPQAAAPSGSHTEKYSPCFSYITRKMSGCFEVHQSYFFLFCWLPPRGQLVPECWNCSKKKRKKRGLF